MRIYIGKGACGMFNRERQGLLVLKATGGLPEHQLRIVNRFLEDKTQYQIKQTESTQESTKEYEVVQ